MRKPRLALLLFVLLGLGVSLIVPAEDVSETAYDESEALPYEGTPLFSIEIPAKTEPSCASLICFNSSMKPRKGRRKENARPHCVRDSLTILHHAIRC